jgi:hypothetical protein
MIHGIEFRSLLGRGRIAEERVDLRPRHLRMRVTGDSVTFSGVPLGALDTFANSVGRAKIPAR